MKRAFDLLFVALFSPAIAAVAAIVAVAVRIAMGKGVIFAQERAGLGGRAFTLYKFRTMLPGDGPDAERLTRFGRFLRASSLDELPEFWNVVRGDMSVVGPRPLPVRYLARYSAFEARRHEVRPGITGWAQIHGRNALDWDAKFRYDVEYVNRHSLLLDLRIIAATVLQVVLPSHISHEGEATMSEFMGKEAQ